MLSRSNIKSKRTVYPVWDRTTRIFHWVNFLCVVLLALLGLAILNADSFGVSSDGKILLKTLHVYVGYIFAANLGWRLVWAFIGGKYSRWSKLLPFGRGYFSELRSYVRAMRSGNERNYLGHNPLGRLMVSLLLILLLSQAVTGLVLAGTDLYKPPFGSTIAAWVTGGDADMLMQLKPGSKEFVDQAAYDDMRSFRKPIVTTHKYVFFLLVGLIVLHILGVVVAELRERTGLVSAMISGDKTMAKPPVDIDSESTGGDGHF